MAEWLGACLQSKFIPVQIRMPPFDMCVSWLVDSGLNSSN